MDKGKRAMKALDDEQLDQVSGGYLYWQNCSGHWQWKVLNENGEECGSFDTRDEAYDYASNNGYSTEEINSDQLQKIWNATGDL